MKVNEAISTTETLLDADTEGSGDTKEGILSKEEREALVALVAVARLAEEARVGIRRYCEELGHRYELICDVLEKLEASGCGV